MSVYSQNFDSLTNGTIAGQDSWTVDATIAAVVEDTVYYGASGKALQVTKVSNNGYAYRDFTITNTGNLTCYIRTADASQYFQIYLTESGTNRTSILVENGDINLNCTGGPIVALADISSNTWYKVQLEWRSSDKKTRMSVNDGTWTNWYASGADGGAGITTGIDGVRCWHWTSNDVTYYVDNIDVSVSGTSYTLTTSVGAFILTGINTLLLRIISIATSLGQFTLTGVNTGLSHVRTLATAVTTYTLTGINTSLVHVRTLTTAVGAFILTGVNVNLNLVKMVYNVSLRKNILISTEKKNLSV